MRRSLQECQRHNNLMPTLKTNKKCVQKCILGGVDVRKNEYPHLVALGFFKPLRRVYEFDCGGTLISKKFIVTAAHCIVNLDKHKLEIARIGTIEVPLQIQSLNLDFDYKVKRTIIHPNYRSNRRRRMNDIALVELETEVKLDLSRRPACLHTAAVAPSQLQVAGWGQTDVNTQRSIQLQKATVTSVPYENCARIYKRKYRTDIDKNQICAYDNNSDTCAGDSGGPLQFKYGNMFNLVGVTSIGGPGCGGSDPSVYTTIYPYLDWIESRVWPG